MKPVIIFKKEIEYKIQKKLEKCGYVVVVTDVEYEWLIAPMEHHQAQKIAFELLSAPNALVSKSEFGRAVVDAIKNEIIQEQN